MRSESDHVAMSGPGLDGGWDLPKTLEQLKPLNITFHEFWIGSTHVPGHKFPVQAQQTPGQPVSVS